LGISDLWKVSINIIITALPALGALLLVRSEAMKREFKTSEIVGVFCIFWGFLLYVTWQYLLLPFNQLSVSLGPFTKAL